MAEGEDAPEPVEKPETQSATTKSAPKWASKQAAAGARTRKTRAKTAVGSETKPAPKRKSARPTARAKAAPETASEVHEAEPAKKAGIAGGSGEAAARAEREVPDWKDASDTGPTPGAGADDQRLPDLLWRFLGLLGFGFLSNILLVLMWLLAAAQYLFIAIGRKPEPQLAGLIDGLAAWLAQIFRYMSGRSAAVDLPFPFSEFPATGDSDRGEAGRDG